MPEAHTPNLRLASHVTNRLSELGKGNCAGHCSYRATRQTDSIWASLSYGINCQYTAPNNLITFSALITLFFILGQQLVEVMVSKKNIYTIYANENKNLAHDLLRHLQLLEKDFNISSWHDEPIYPKQPWKPKNMSRLHQADIYLLLVSDAFMHSEFIQQNEFKMIIDRYKVGASIVLPILVDNCPWNIEFNSDDYNFSLMELEVLPVDRKPISEWNSTDEALRHVIDSLKRIISPTFEDTVPDIANGNLEENTAKLIREKQIAINFEEASELEGGEKANKPLETEKIKKNTELELQVREKAKSITDRREKAKFSEEAEPKEAADEANRHTEKTEAIKKAEEEERTKMEAAAKKAALEAKELRNAALEKEKADAENQTTEVDELGPSTWARREEPETENEKKVKTKRRVLVGLGIALLAVAGVWFFKTDLEKSVPTSPNTLPVEATDSVVSTNPADEPVDQEDSFSKLAVGDAYAGGIIFTIDPSGTSGKIAAPKDAGPMPWEEANAIHNELGEGWRLPTLDELQTIYRTIGQGASNSGQFADELYWSATPYDTHQARLLRFSDGNASYHYNRRLAERKFHVRAIRDFSQ